MIITKLSRGLVVLLVMQILPACTYVKSLFPDKERDYQFRAEIPDLVIPVDLKTRSFLDKSAPKAAAPAPTVVAAREPVAPVVDAPVSKKSKTNDKQAKSAAKQPEATRPAPAPAPVAAAVVAEAPITTVSHGDISSLQIDQSQNQAWRMVARALGRQNLEIVERNIDKGYFYIKYDPDQQKPQEKSMWDEVKDVFANDESHEQEYRISLLEIAPQSTEVTVQDVQGNTLSDVNATHLLKLITDGINQDAAPSTQDKPAAP